MWSSPRETGEIGENTGKRWRNIRKKWRAKNRYHAFAFGNVNPYCVDLSHDVTPFSMQWYAPALLIAYSIYCNVTRTHLKRRFNLHKTNAANEGAGDQTGVRMLGPEKRTIYPDCSLHSNSFSNEMGNSLLDVREINRKFIVVGKEKNFEKSW